MIQTTCVASGHTATKNIRNMCSYWGTISATYQNTLTNPKISGICVSYRYHITDLSKDIVLSKEGSLIKHKLWRLWFLAWPEKRGGGNRGGVTREARGCDQGVLMQASNVIFTHPPEGSTQLRRRLDVESSQLLKVVNLDLTKFSSQWIYA